MHLMLGLSSAYGWSIPPGMGFQLKCMCVPCTAYAEGNVTPSQARLISFILNIPTIGNIATTSTIMVRHDKKLLKQVGLASAYMNSPLVLPVPAFDSFYMVMEQDLLGLSGFGLLLMMFGDMSFVFGANVRYVRGRAGMDRLGYGNVL